jgi:putative addiction module component (TIGR02574 family)
MSLPISIDKLSLSEKIELMEKLWEDLSSDPGYTTPKWHGEELDRRRKDVKEGNTSYTEWDKAKEEIRKTIS